MIEADALFFGTFLVALGLLVLGFAYGRRYERRHHMPPPPRHKGGYEGKPWLRVWSVDQQGNRVPVEEQDGSQDGG